MNYVFPSTVTASLLNNETANHVVGVTVSILSYQKLHKNSVNTISNNGNFNCLWKEVRPERLKASPSNHNSSSLSQFFPWITKIYASISYECVQS